jgi:hypothetical protein
MSAAESSRRPPRGSRLLGALLLSMILGACPKLCPGSQPPAQNPPDASDDAGQPDSGMDAGPDANPYVDSGHPQCYAHPTTYLELINACTNAISFPLSSEPPCEYIDGGLPPLGSTLPASCLTGDAGG